MNENEEEDEAVPSNPPKLLSGNSLLQIHLNAGKSLPKDGLKDFAPTNSWMEKKQIQSALGERRELLDEERVEKWSCLASAVWDHKKKLAEVIRRSGKHFQTLGFEKEGRLYLYPEEALYLLEINSLELTFGGVPVSIQQGYSILLESSSGCNLIEYRTFSHLLRQGYRLLRFRSQKLHTKYERIIRLDQHLPIKRIDPDQFSSVTENLETTELIKSEALSCSSVLFSEPSKFAVKREEKVDKMYQSEVELECADDKAGAEQSKESADPVMEVVKESQEPVSGIQEQLEAQETQDNSSTVASQDGNESTVGQNKVSDNSTEQLERPDTCPEESSECIILEQLEEQPVEICQENSSVPVNKELETDCDQVPENVEKDCDLTSNERDNPSTSQIESVKSKAFDIAEGLVSLGNTLLDKDTNNSEFCGKAEGNMSSNLQEEIIKVLGTHVESHVSKDTLAALASSAAETILTHLSSNTGQAECDDKDGIRATEPQEAEKITSEVANAVTSDENVCPQPTRDGTVEGDGASPMPSAEPTVVSEDEEVLEMDHCSDLDLNNSNDSMDYTMKPSSPMKKSTLEKEVDDSCGLKRPASSSAIDEDCEPVLIKRAKVAENSDAEIEILDTAPEQKQIELVNLSDESSMDSEDSNETDHESNNGHNNEIEVIDVNDSSSSGETQESGADSDSSVMVEDDSESSHGWDKVRKNILEAIPNMSNLSEIFLTPPHPDLLPRNVHPQHERYIISRRRLLADGKNAEVGLERHAIMTHHTTGPRPSNNFEPNDSRHHQVLPPNMPINPVAAVQAIAQLVLPMLGIQAPDPMWLMSNSWPPTQQRPWGQGPRFNFHNRGNNWQRHYRRRPYGYRPRYHYHRRGSNFNPRNNTSVSEVRDFERTNEVVPYQFVPNTQNEGSFDVSQNSNQQRSWMQQHIPRKQGKAKRSRARGSLGRSRYFSHLHKHMGKYEENLEVIGVKAGDTSSESEHCNSPNVKSESDSSDEDSKSDIVHTIQNENSNCSVNEGNQSTDGSCNSALEAKPLLSPSECTNFGNVFRSIQVIKQVKTETLISNAYGELLKPQFDLFSPNKPFKKGSPPLPDFHLCIMSHDEAVPTPGRIQALYAALDDKVPIMFAVVSPDSISFLELSDVCLPSSV